MDDLDLPLLDRSLAEPRHLLVLSTEVDPAEVEALAVSHFDDAAWTSESSLRLTGAAQLTGPWRLDAALRSALDLPRWAAAAMLLRCPIERSAPVPRELLGLGGLLDAFPDGEPVGLEGEVLGHLLAQARRLAGALRLAGSGTVLVPDPASAVDLTVHSSVWLDPEAAVRVLAEVLPGVGLLHAADPGQPAGRRDPLAPDPAGLRAGAAEALDAGERAWLHAEAEALDQAVLHQPQVLEGYALVAPLTSRQGTASAPAPAADQVEIGVAGDVPPAPVLRAAPWARAGVVTYEVRWRPADPEVALGARPSLGARRRRADARLSVERIARALHHVVGGELVDDDGFLVAVETLTD